jgi:predicted dehydrogenase
MSPNHNSTPPIAVIGCGAITESFYLPALKALSIMEHVILVDTNIKRAQDLATQFGAKEVAGNYREVVSKVRGAIVAVPHHLHYPVSKEFLQNGVHLLCEKPLAEFPDQATDMVRLAESSNVTIGVNHTRRFLPSYARVKNLLDNGAIGAVRSITYLDGGEFNWPTASGFYFDSKISNKGVLLDIGTHLLVVGGKTKSGVIF